MEDNFCNNCQKNVSAANFATHSAFCERNIKVCKLCNEPVPISEEKQHLEDFHVAIPCDLCEIVLEKWMMSEHKESCTKRPTTCEYCDGEFPFKEYSEHLEFCSSRTEKCLLCQKYVMLKDKRKHSEMHSYEKNIRHSNIDSEIKQNIINEVISNSSVPEQSIQDKVAENCSITSGRAIVNNGETHLNIKVPAEASACALDITKKMSKHYAVCHICNQNIPWIDMNTHIPSCASDAGKCSRCGEDVPNHEIKDHVLKNCKMLLTKDSSFNKADVKRDRTSKNEALYVAEKHIKDEDMKSCPYCDQLCSVDRIVEHVKSCCENSFECPMCNLIVHEKDKIKHESLDCRSLLDTDNHLLYSNSSFDAQKNSYDKNKKSSDTEMTRKGRIMKDESHSLRNTNESYADAARKSSFQKKEKANNSSNCKPCCPCYKNSFHKGQEHSYTCQRNQKNHCFYCFEEIYVKDEDTHLSKCKGFQANESLRSAGHGDYKGAVRSRFPDMVKPQVAECKFCKTVLNADIVCYHEKDCIYQPLTCDQCNDHFPLKDLDKHVCISKKGKGNQKKQVKDQQKNGSGVGIKGRLQSFFGVSNNDRGHDGSKFHSDYAYMYGNYEDPFSFVDTDDVKIPCEFCGELYSAFFIVEHETGCEPELVGVRKKESHEGIKSKAEIYPQQTNMFQHDSVSEKKLSSFDTKTDLLANRSASRFARIKEHIESDVKPGEFLQNVCDDKTSETSADLQTGSLGFPSNPSIQSVWNINVSNTETKATDLRSSPHVSSFVNENKSEMNISPQTSYFPEEKKSKMNVLPQGSSFIKEKDNKMDVTEKNSEMNVKEKNNEMNILQTQKKFQDKNSSDDEMSELLEFINEGTPNTADKGIPFGNYDELRMNYYKKKFSNFSSDQNLHLQRHHEDKPENKEYLECAKSASSISKEAMDVLSGDVSFDLKRLKLKHNSNIAFENEKQAFTVEPIGAHLKYTSTKKFGRETDHYVKNNQNVKTQPSPQESYFETSEDELEKWEKWHHKPSNNS